ncbi:MAG: RnfH family protein [Thiomonas sp.]|uniref:RnfH family protein n=1 Tax=Thiomonas sp. TaxID=2047785 RepID=UPI002A35D825|nr:RnfH family protein [Thiomonas sp.]MDY0329945.1 RnfH family protein [Thiomonas sp.]
MGRAEAAKAVRVAVFYAAETGAADLREVALPAGATVAQALQLSGMLAAHPELATLDIGYGIDGRRVALQRVLQDGDRIDLCRALQVDPMTARRLRAAAAKKAAISKPRR